MGKNSFTLFETILSLTILAVAVSIIYKIVYSNNFHKQFKLLNSYENSFTKNSYDSTFTKNSSKLTIYENKISKNIDVIKIQTNDENIRLFKYELTK